MSNAAPLPSLSPLLSRPLAEQAQAGRIAFLRGRIRAESKALDAVAFLDGPQYVAESNRVLAELATLRRELRALTETPETQQDRISAALADHHEELAVTRDYHRQAWLRWAIASLCRQRVALWRAEGLCEEHGDACDCLEAAQ